MKFNHWLSIIFIGIPSAIIFFFSGIYTLFFANQVAIMPQTECKPLFIFTPQDVKYCSDIYLIDSILLALQRPVTYITLISGAVIIGFVWYYIRLYKELNQGGEV
ncbi:hypothetical protein [Falsibacillus pallidus]|uniref:hypothetical protein n=1 Tax=Falsibacillus pallidus TaxID=493781 RepID=UPI003D95AC2E